jgi:dolichyl-diphosphooligosaccharide--protein glycosyltransferase/undecaprenyl-diphosphooligosaccharide--protein glycosyltransferase
MMVTQEKESTKVLLLLLAVAYVFSIVVRLIWVDYASGQPQYFWNDQIMINTNDGYFWAEGARDVLNGIYDSKDGAPTQIWWGVTYITAMFAYILPVKFETLILYMPAFLGGLLVVPIILIGRAIGETTAGFIAALFGGIVWSYYNRTMIGYYDSDMLTIVFSTFLLAWLILASVKKEDKYLILIPATIMLYAWWYSQSYSINVALIGIFFLYFLLFDRKDGFYLKVISVALIAISSLSVTGKIVLILALVGLYRYVKQLTYRHLILLAGASFAVLVVYGGIEPITYQLKKYVVRDVVTTAAPGVELYFYKVDQTVREAGKIPFTVLADRISGHAVIFLASLTGYALLLWRHKIMLLSLPMVGLGFLAYVGGLRFTVYAVPVLAIATGYLIVVAMNRVTHRGAYFGGLALLTAAILAPNIKHVADYKVPTVMMKAEVEVLDHLEKVASRDDYVLSWWDYGYPIRYYADVKTLADGGIHTGKVNFPVSYALTKPQEVSAQMARLDVEYYEWTAKKERPNPYLETVMKDYDFNDPNLFLDALEAETLEMPAKSVDVYYYLPLRMLDIYSTVTLFSHLDLSTGQANAKGMLYQTTSFKEDGRFIDLGRGIVLDKSNSTVKVNGKNVPLSKFIHTAYDAKGKLVVTEKQMHPSAKLVLVFMQSYNRFLLMDHDTLESAYMQLFVLERFDPELFEPVVFNPLAKVYRLKQ